MPSDDEQIITRVSPGAEDQELELNEPEQSALSSGPREYLSKSDRRQRMRVMERLLASGESDSAIEAAMEKKFGMNEAAVGRCIESVFSKWAAEDMHRNPHLKSSARRRIYSHLSGAKADRNWSAVANLEKVLSGIEGTSVDPKEAQTPAELRLKESMLTLLGELDQTAAIQIIEREMTISIKGGGG